MACVLAFLGKRSTHHTAAAAAADSVSASFANIHTHTAKGQQKRAPTLCLFRSVHPHARLCLCCESIFCSIPPARKNVSKKVVSHGCAHIHTHTHTGREHEQRAGGSVGARIHFGSRPMAMARLRYPGNLFPRTQPGLPAGMHRSQHESQGE